MTDQRIKELMAQCGLPESRSLYSALKQLETEVRIEYGDTPWQAARATAEQPVPTPEPFGYVYRIISESRPHDPMYRFAKTGELNPDPEVVKSWTKHPVYLTSQLSRTRDSVIEECCAAIKAEDDRMSDEDYMLDSDDCIRVCRALKSQQDAAIEAKQAEPAYPDELTPELREVLGWPNFKCARFAHLMVAAGAEIKPKAEDEQAAVLHWLIKLVLKHGDKWNEAATTDLSAMRDKVQSIEAQRSGDGS